MDDVLDLENRIDEVSIYDLLKRKEIWTNLIATGGGWFIYDVCFCEYINSSSLACA
jgi:hypothetical protein